MDYFPFFGLLFFYLFTYHGEQFREGLIQLLIAYIVDIEINPGPKMKSQLSFRDKNLNGFSAHNLVKVSVLQALAVTHEYDIINLSETFLDLSISNGNEIIRIEGYNLLWVDHPSNK